MASIMHITNEDNELFWKTQLFYTSFRVAKFKVDWQLHRQCVPSPCVDISLNWLSLFHIKAHFLFTVFKIILSWLNFAFFPSVWASTCKKCDWNGTTFPKLKKLLNTVTTQLPDTWLPDASYTGHLIVHYSGHMGLYLITRTLLLCTIVWMVWSSTDPRRLKLVKRFQLQLC